jgi:microcystin degradation protein MlrC
MRVFCAGLFTESNGLVARPTTRADFDDGFLWRRGAPLPARSIGATMSAPVSCWVDACQARGWVVHRGLTAFAMPGGPVLQADYEALRDELLADLVAAGPVDFVLLALHGSMRAQGYADVEGDLLGRVRAHVGPHTPIGVEMDPHCNVSQAVLGHATVLVTYKEWPHTDIRERALDVLQLTAEAASGATRPTLSTFDCRIVGTFPTKREPMKSFVGRMSALEGRDGVLSVSLLSGYPWGDVAEQTVRVLVITNDAPELGARLADTLGRELWALRARITDVPAFDIDGACDYLDRAPPGLIVFADPADNLLCGCPGDSTYVLARVLERGLQRVAFGPIYDPMAVQAAARVGERARLTLRIGGKCEPLSGVPVDVPVTVRRVLDNPVQHLTEFADAPSELGAAVWVEAPGEIDILLTSNRVPTVSPNVFEPFGLKIAEKRAAFCKMWQHGAAGFANIAVETHVIAAPGAGSLDYASLPYRAFQAPFWPKFADLSLDPP